ncbi:MAG: response regulator [Planctomycetota bacterium]
MQPVAPGTKRPRLLIADDAVATRNGLAELMRRRGYRSLQAANGSEAIELLKQESVDGLVLDLQMPGTDGFAVLDYVAEHRRGLPVVLLSGLAADEIQDRMANLASPNLPPLFLKPVDADQMLDVMELLLSGELPTDPSAV